MTRFTDLLKGALGRRGGRETWPLDAVPAAADLEPGMVIGEQYRILAVLGEGGFGRVFQCANWQGRHCAVKTLRPERARDPETVAMMRAEVQRWVELGVHPHIVTAFGLVEHARLPCVVMEEVYAAKDLAQIIRRGGGHWTTALHVGAQVAAALDHGQRRSGLVHRDIKPENILVASDDWARLSDFGISVAQLTEADTLGHLLLGTAPYMAPELWGAAPRYTVQSDLYALGVTLYEVSVGRHPLTDGRPGFDAYGRLHETATPRSPLQIDPTMPPAFAAFLLQCLDKDPARRPADAAEATQRLVEMCRVYFQRSPLRSAADTAIDEADTWVNRSSMYHQLGLAGEAMECARNALARTPDNADALLSLGNACALAGRTAEALAALGRAVAAADPYDLAAPGSLAHAQFKAGNRDAARAALETVLERLTGPDSYAQIDKISDLVAELLEPARALAVCERIVAQQPQAAMTWNNRAALLRRMGRPRDALASARRALALDPVYAKAWTNLANAALELSQPEDARVAAAKAIELDPGLAGAYAALYAASMALGDAAGAEAALDDGLAALPGNPLLLQNRDLLAAYKRDRGIASDEAAAPLPDVLDGSVIEQLAAELAAALHEMWRERIGLLGGRNDAERTTHDLRSHGLNKRIRAIGVALQDRGGIAAMHDVVRALNRIDARCRDAVEANWTEIAGYRRCRFLP